MNEPTPEQIAKLPKWAQLIVRERDEAIADLKAYRDEQTPSLFYEEYQGPAMENRYIQARSIIAEFDGVRLRVDCFRSGQYGPGIRMQWESTDRQREIALIPQSFQYARLVAKGDMA